MGNPMWPPGATEMFAELAAKGWSAGQIARELSAKYGRKFTRSGVIGKAHRKGVKLKGNTVEEETRVRRGAVENQNRVPAKFVPKPGRIAGFAAPPGALASTGSTGKSPSLPPERDEPMPGERRCTLMELKEDRCKWPIGTPGAENFCFCGAKASSNPKDKPYCKAHADIAYPGAP